MDNLYSDMPNDCLVFVGEKITRTLQYSQADVAQFSRLSADKNPLHTDAAVAERGRFGQITASGQQTAAILMGMLATHYSRTDDGVARQMICLNMNFAFKAPVFTDQDIALWWHVVTVTPNSKLKGLLAHLDGQAAMFDDKPAVVARGTILVSVA
jgi:acyl dehydratase